MRPGRSVRVTAAAVAVTALAACTSSGSGDGSSAPAPSTSSSVVSSTAPPSSPASSTTSSAAAKLVYRSGLALPDPDVTPGAAITGVTRAQVCTKTWNARHNKIGFAVQNAVSNRYDVVAGPGTSLHLDQLIPASLGGTATAANVWPQPDAQLARKNALESHLHQLVCSGDLPLTTAQRAVAADWPAALRRYPPA